MKTKVASYLAKWLALPCARQCDIHPQISKQFPEIQVLATLIRLGQEYRMLGGICSYFFKKEYFNEEFSCSDCIHRFGIKVQCKVPFEIHKEFLKIMVRYLQAMKLSSLRWEDAIFCILLCQPFPEKDCLRQPILYWIAGCWKPSSFQFLWFS